MSDLGSCGDNNVEVSGGFGTPVRIKLRPKTSGRMGGDDLVVSESRGDDGTREIILSPKPQEKTSE